MLVFLLTFLSCNPDKIKEYYPDGSLKSSYFKKDGLIQGEYKLYYENEFLKEIHKYKQGNRIDSSIYYYPHFRQGKIQQVRYWNDSTNFCINYNKAGEQISKGWVKNDDLNERIGNWIFYSQKFDSIVEYKNINGKTYSNQLWLINSIGDTIPSRGNYYELFLKDTISIGDILRVRFFLSRPYTSYDSDVEVVLPYRDTDLKGDYSNLFEIERDTFASLKNDGIPHPEIPNDVPINHYVEFGLEYESIGEKRIRGVLLEYVNQDHTGFSVPDSIERIERRLYFDKRIYVKNK